MASSTTQPLIQTRPTKSTHIRYDLFAVFYVSLIALVIIFYSFTTDYTNISKDIGNITGFLSLLVFTIQFALSSRFPLLCRFLGLQAVWQWHAAQSLAILVLVSIHVYYRVIEPQGTGVLKGLLTSFFTYIKGKDPFFYAGQLSVIIFLIVFISATLRSKIGIPKKSSKLSHSSWFSIHLIAYLCHAAFIIHVLLQDHSGLKMGMIYGLVTLYLAVLGWRIWRKIDSSMNKIATVASVTPVSHLTVELVLSVPITRGGMTLHTASPGSFIMLTRPHKGFRALGSKHPFSVAGTELHTDTVSVRLLIKETPNPSFTGEVRSLPIGSFIRWEGPYGKATPSMARSLVLAAGGSGVSAASGVMKACIHQHLDCRLVYSVKRASDVVIDELKTAASNSVPTVLCITSQLRSDAREEVSAFPQSPSITVVYERINSDIISLLGVPDSAEACIWGPEAFIGAVKRILIDEGVDSASILTEPFVM